MIDSPPFQSPQEPDWNPGGESGRARLVRELAAGQVRRGVVTEVAEYGGRIDLGGVVGLLLIVDLSWGRVSHPSELVSVGDAIDVKVLDLDWTVGRLQLGLKQLTPNPWTGVEERYPVGTRVRGRVVSIPSYGAFVELEPLVEALLPTAEMRAEPVRHPSHVVSLGDEVEVVVIHVDEEAEKMTVSMRRLEGG